MIILSSVKSGTKVKIAKIDAKKGMSGRMAAMGIIPGTEVKVMQNDMKGPIVLLVKDSKIALGRVMTDKITVT